MKVVFSLALFWLVSCLNSGVVPVSTAAQGQGERAVLEPIVPLKITRGKTTTLEVILSVNKGLHVNANPATQKYLIPTSLKLAPHPSFKFGVPEYPKSKKFRFAGSKNDIDVYDGKVKVRVSVDTLPNSKPGKTQITGKLRYQACDDKNCFPPKTLPVTVPVTLL